MPRSLGTPPRAPQAGALLSVVRDIPLTPAQAKEVIRKAISSARCAIGTAHWPLMGAGQWPHTRSGACLCPARRAFTPRDHTQEPRAGLGTAPTRTCAAAPKQNALLLASAARGAELQQLPPILYQLLLVSAAGPRVYALGKTSELFEHLGRQPGNAGPGGRGPSSVLLQVGAPHTVTQALLSRAIVCMWACCRAPTGRSMRRPHRAAIGLQHSGRAALSRPGRFSSSCCLAPLCRTPPPGPGHCADAHIDAHKV
jgi:hypothetical protein